MTHSFPTRRSSDLAAMISAGAGAFPETTTLISPLGGATQLNNGGIDSAFSAGLQAGGQMYSKRLLERLDKDPFYVRVPAGRSEEHTSELQSLMRTSYAVFCLKNKNNTMSHN